MSHICNQFHQFFNAIYHHSFPYESTAIPLNGIYILFEKGEEAHGTQRIVRVGTHTGENQLPSRLKQHFLNENKDRSIFRKHIGRAILNRDADPYMASWELDLTTSEAKRKYASSIDAQKQKAVERQVTEYIQNCFSFAVIGMDDPRKRLAWESAILSTIAQCRECGPSKGWLGHHSPKEKIRESGLWNINGLNEGPLSEQDNQDIEGVIRQR